MDSCAFQDWVEVVMPQLVQLNIQQTRLLFEAFTKKCSRPQKLFLETEMPYLLTQDFFELPSLVVDRILGCLDIDSLLTLRLVCPLWRDSITKNANLWRKKCWERGGNVEDCQNPSPSPSFFFRMHQGLRSIVRLIETGAAFTKTPSTVCPQNLTEPLQKFGCSLIAYGSNILAIATKDRRVFAFDAETKRLRWEKKGNVVSCLHIDNDLILTGTHWGQLRVLSLDGSFQCEKQFGCNSVTALDVHESGRFVLMGFCDGSIRLVDNVMSHNSVNLDPPKPGSLSSGEGFKETLIKKIWFMSDRDLPPGHMAICVCFRHSLTLAVIEATGKVKECHVRPSKNEITSFQRCRSDPHVLYTSEKLSPWTIGIVKYEMRPAVPSSGSSLYGLEKTNVMVETAEHVYSARSAFSVFILAAGKRFLLVANACDLVIFDLVLCRPFTTVSNFFTSSMPILEHSLDCLTTVDGGWLDGLTPSRTQPHRPLLIFGLNTRSSGDLTLFSLRWSPGLWKRWALCQTSAAHMACLFSEECRCHAYRCRGAMANFCGRSTNPVCCGDTDRSANFPHPGGRCKAWHLCNGCGAQVPHVSAHGDDGGCDDGGCDDGGCDYGGCDDGGCDDGGCDDGGSSSAFLDLFLSANQSIVDGQQASESIHRKNGQNEKDCGSQAPHVSAHPDDPSVFHDPRLPPADDIVGVHQLCESTAGSQQAGECSQRKNIYDENVCGTQIHHTSALSLLPAKDIDDTQQASARESKQRPTSHNETVLTAGDVDNNQCGRGVDLLVGGSGLGNLSGSNNQIADCGHVLSVAAGERGSGTGQKSDRGGEGEREERGIWRSAVLFKQRADQMVAGQTHCLVSADGVIDLDVGVSSLR